MIPKHVHIYIHCQVIAVAKGTISLAGKWFSPHLLLQLAPEGLSAPLLVYIYLGGLP